MTVFEYGGRLLIVDCGVLFPEEEQPGIDLILPDFSSIRDRLDDIEGIVLTHGHEDHIGGVPFLLREKPDIPLIGSKLTLALIEAKLQEHRIRPYTLEVAEGHRERVGPFDCASSSRSTTPSRTRWPSPSARPRAWSSTPATGPAGSAGGKPRENLSGEYKGSVRSLRTQQRAKSQRQIC
ncbi:Ribonuclease J [Streptomyces violaceorubidus]